MREKPNEDALWSILLLTVIAEHVGERLQHHNFDYHGKEKWSPYVPEYLKPDFDAELVFLHDCEGKLSYCDFSDFQNSIVKLTFITPTDLFGKRIRQRFTKKEENDF